MSLYMTNIHWRIAGDGVLIVSPIPDTEEEILFFADITYSSKSQAIIAGFEDISSSDLNINEDTLYIVSFIAKIISWA